MARATKPTGKTARDDRAQAESRVTGETPKRSRRKRGGDPRTMPGSQELGDQQRPQTTGGMVKGT